MTIDRDPNLTAGESPMLDQDTNVSRPEMNTLDPGMTSSDRDAGGSNFLAFLVGGLVIAIGLLAFLFYDGGSTTGRDVNTTGSTTPRLEAPATPASPSTPATPSRPAQ